MGGSNLLHHKRLLFERLLAAGGGMARYLPETYVDYESFSAAPSELPAAFAQPPDRAMQEVKPAIMVKEGMHVRAIENEVRFTGDNAKIWYFKRSTDDNGRGLVVFSEDDGRLCEAEIKAVLDEKVRLHIIRTARIEYVGKSESCMVVLDEKKRQRQAEGNGPKGPVGFKVRKRATERKGEMAVVAESESDNNNSESERRAEEEDKTRPQKRQQQLDGVYQRCVPRMMLWRCEAGACTINRPLITMHD